MLVGFACSGDDSSVPPAEIIVTSPLPQTVVWDVVEITVEVENDVPVERVDIFIDDYFLGRDQTEPFQLQWDTNVVPSKTYSDRSHTISINAVDLRGHFIRTEVPVNVRRFTKTNAEGAIIGPPDPNDWCSGEIGLWAYPNPARNTVNFQLGLTQESLVQLEIVDLEGQPVRILIDDEPMSAGQYLIRWEVNRDDVVVPAGMYRAILTTAEAHCYGDIVVVKD